MREDISPSRSLLRESTVSPNAQPFAAVARVVEAELGRRYSAAVVRIEAGGRAVYEAAWGRTHRFAGARDVEVDTRFDLASLTKVFVSTAALRAVETGALDLDRPVAEVLREWRDDERRVVTLRMLLAHTGGLASGADYRGLFDTDVAAEVLRRPAVARPGARVIYSDLGFIALGILLERVLCTSLERAVAALLGPGFPSLGFRPREIESIPGTEIDEWRGLVQGRVHDEKAALLGGVAGHAGLFGTARDVARLAEAYLAPLHGRRRTILATRLAGDALAEAGADGILRRGLGWALKTSDENSCGRRIAFAAFGHTGFTGTCTWSDPLRDVTIVFLTNAVHYGRSDLRLIRAAICDAAIEALEGLACGEPPPIRRRRISEGCGSRAKPD